MRRRNINWVPQASVSHLAREIQRVLNKDVVCTLDLVDLGRARLACSGSLLKTDRPQIGYAMIAALHGMLEQEPGSEAFMDHRALALLAADKILGTREFSTAAEDPEIAMMRAPAPIRQYKDD